MTKFLRSKITLTALIIVGLMFGSSVFADVFDDNFDAYSNLQILTSGTGNWEAGGSAKVNNTQSQSTPNSGKFFGSENYGVLGGEKNPTATSSFAVYMSTCPAGSAATFLHYNDANFTEQWELNASAGICQLKRGSDLIGTFALNSWTTIIFAWNNPTNKIRASVDGGENWSAWLTPRGNLGDGISRFMIIAQSGGVFYLDDFQDFPFESSIEITTPVSGSTITEAITFGGNYNTEGENWNRIMLVFEQWHASSTCPVYGDEMWDDEYGQGWFYYQSYPFFSESFATATGTFAILANDLRVGTYNCVRCYFINEAGALTSVPKCPNYWIKVGDAGIPYTILPLQFPIQSWESYYASNSEKFTTTTALFSGIVNSLNPIIQKISGFIIYFKDVFNTETATEKGTELGSAFPTARGYLTFFDDFFGSFPISALIIFYLTFLIAVIVYKIILQILKLIKP